MSIETILNDFLSGDFTRRPQFHQLVFWSVHDTFVAVAVAVNIHQLPRTANAVVATVTTANFFVRSPRFFPVAVPRFAVAVAVLSNYRAPGYGSYTNFSERTITIH